MIKLDLEGVAVSAGAACSSGKVGASHVLEAMGLAPEIARSAIRVSLGWATEAHDVEAFLRAWTDIREGLTSRIMNLPATPTGRAAPMHAMRLGD